MCVYVWVFVVQVIRQTTVYQIPSKPILLDVCVFNSCLGVVCERRFFCITNEKIARN